MLTTLHVLSRPGGGERLRAPPGSSLPRLELMGPARRNSGAKVEWVGVYKRDEVHMITKLYRGLGASVCLCMVRTAPFGLRGRQSSTTKIMSEVLIVSTLKR